MSAVPEVPKWNPDFCVIAWGPEQARAIRYARTSAMQDGSVSLSWLQYVEAEKQSSGGSSKIRLPISDAPWPSATAPTFRVFQKKLLETGFQRGNKLVRLPSAGVRFASEEAVNQPGLFGTETTMSADMPDRENED